mgnify:CR=1 FL=1|jgi:hypothetical protein|tara:strand:+ start:716 stop:970 length:255 start_codon:yes stop_codon:yes gene_type:complete
MTEVTEVQEVQEQPDPAANVQLGLQDIAMMVQVIDLCSKRGSFEGAELEPIGSLRGRIVAFLNAAAPPKQDGEAVEEPSVPEEG